MKKGIQIIFSLFIFLSFNSFAQWNQIGHMTIGADTANSVDAYEGFGINLYAATNKGIFKSTDDGNNWLSISYNVPVTQSVSMLSVFEESVTTIYAGGDKRLYKSTNGGASWSWLPLPKDTINITDIKRSGNNIVVSYNKNFASGGVYYSNNNGSTWSGATGIPAANFMQDLLVEGDTVYVSGKGGVYKSADNGMTFAPLGTGLPNARTITRHQGSLFAGDGGGTGLYVSTNNGATWTLANASAFGGFCQVFSVQQVPTMIMAAVSGNTACINTTGPIKASVDGGSTWMSYTVGLTGGTSELGVNSALTYFFCKNGKKNYRTALITGIKEASNEPPFIAYFDQSGVLNIGVDNGANLDVRVYSIEGKLLYSENTTESKIIINDLKNLNAGIYLVSLSADNKVLSTKIIKQE